MAAMLMAQRPSTSDLEEVVENLREAIGAEVRIRTNVVDWLHWPMHIKDTRYDFNQGVREVWQRDAV